MAARAIWKGVLGMDGLRLPVKFYSAVQDRGLHFRLLHDQDMTPLRQRMVSATTGEEVAYGEARRGYEIDRGVFVLLDEEELKQLQPDASRDIEVICFLDPDKVSHDWYERPYFVGPDGDERVYRAVVEGLRRQDKVALVRWVMRGTEYLGALREEDGYLMVVTLRHPEQIVSGSALPTPSGRTFSKKERQMGQQLVKALAGPFKPEQYHDQFRDRVLELIHARQRGESITLEEPEERGEPDSLGDALEASLKAVK